MDQAISVEHYTSVAPNYDKFHGPQSDAMAKFIQNLIPSTPSNQLIDVGGGTAQCANTIKANLGMTKPVVCIDPSQDMLDIALQNGAITIQATAEEFLASEPSYPLKVVIMNGCVHLFEKPDFVFSQLAHYMPEDGVCIVTKYSSTTLPLFKAAKLHYTQKADILERMCKIIESKGLQCRIVCETAQVQLDKAVWYESIRNRYNTTLINFSDEELDEGIKELEEEFKDHTVLNFEAIMKAIVITKK